jgi:hypothetical protein
MPRGQATPDCEVMNCGEVSCRPPGTGQTAGSGVETCPQDGIVEADLAPEARGDARYPSNSRGVKTGESISISFYSDTA